MNAELEDLKIIPREIEGLTGDQGSEYAHLLNQALQIAVSVQQKIHQISIEQ